MKIVYCLLTCFIAATLARGINEGYYTEEEETTTLAGNLCFPLKQNSFSRISVNWGGLRSGGARCHAGLDIYSKSPGTVIAIEDGVVTNIFNFLSCKDGWACAGGKCGTSGRQTVAVLVYHAKLGKTVNYGEIDGDKIKVRVGQTVTKGTQIGVAGYCGMLHFEYYEGKQSANFRWQPPAGGSSANPDKCARQYLRTKPAALLDPRPMITSTLKDAWC